MEIRVTGAFQNPVHPKENLKTKRQVSQLTDKKSAAILKKFEVT